MLEPTKVPGTAEATNSRAITDIGIDQTIGWRAEVDLAGLPDFGWLVFFDFFRATADYCNESTLSVYMEQTNSLCDEKQKSQYYWSGLIDLLR